MSQCVNLMEFPSPWRISTGSRSSDLSISTFFRNIMKIKNKLTSTYNATSDDDRKLRRGIPFKSTWRFLGNFTSIQKQNVLYDHNAIVLQIKVLLSRFADWYFARFLSHSLSPFVDYFQFLAALAANAKWNFFKWFAHSRTHERQKRWNGFPVDRSIEKSIMSSLFPTHKTFNVSHSLFFYLAKPWCQRSCDCSLHCQPPQPAHRYTQNYTSRCRLPAWCSYSIARDTT